MSVRYSVLKCSCIYRKKCKQTFRIGSFNNRLLVVVKRGLGVNAFRMQLFVSLIKVVKRKRGRGRL